MNKNIVEQEQICLQIKDITYLLRTKLFELENFPDYKKWNRKLKSLKKQVDDIYWKL